MNQPQEQSQLFTLAALTMGARAREPRATPPPVGEGSGLIDFAEMQRLARERPQPTAVVMTPAATVVSSLPSYASGGGALSEPDDYERVVARGHRSRRIIGAVACATTFVVAAIAIAAFSAPEPTPIKPAPPPVVATVIAAPPPAPFAAPTPPAPQIAYVAPAAPASAPEGATASATPSKGHKKAKHHPSHAPSHGAGGPKLMKIISGGT